MQDYDQEFFAEFHKTTHREHLHGLKYEAYHNEIWYDTGSPELIEVEITGPQYTLANYYTVEYENPKT